MSDVIKFDTVTQAFGIQSQFKCSGYGLGAMIAPLNEPKVLEIGCDIGDTTQFLLDSNPTCVLTGIDPYVNYVDWNGNNLNEREVVYERFMARMSGYKNRFALLREYSDDAAGRVYENFFDLIFIDGLHEYDQLTKDCANFYSKLKEGGIFAGHDYNAIAGVRKAADEFAAKCGKQILITECDVWYWVK
jgi:predicted O-methyltransferase YrrM